MNDVIGTPSGGAYRIVETLAAEAPVEAYRALALDGSTVVVKAVRVRGAEGVPDALEAARAIDHPNVVRVVDVVVRDGSCFIVYDDVAGVTLDTIPVTAGDVPARDVAGWGAQAAAGLEAIHAAGLVHGRVRPSSLVLTPEGTVMVADLGLCDALGPADLTAQAPASAAAYVSPEEVLARPLLPASDTYSLGVVLYRLVTGVAPMGGDDAFEVAKRHADGLVRAPRELDSTIPVDLERTILSSLSKTPDDRYSTARAMRIDLERVVAGEPVTAPATSVAAGHRKSPLLPWALVAGAITLVAVLAILWLAGLIGGAGVEVPDVTGLPVGEATARLASAGLEVGDLTYDAGDPTAVHDTVLAQDPPAGDEVDEGTRVDLVLAGVQPGSVPDVRGMDQATAAQTLADAGYSLGAVTMVADADVAAGLVVDQSPAAGTPAAARDERVAHRVERPRHLARADADADGPDADSDHAHPDADGDADDPHADADGVTERDPAVDVRRGGGGHAAPAPLFAARALVALAPSDPAQSPALGLDATLGDRRHQAGVVAPRRDRRRPRRSRPWHGRSGRRRPGTRRSRCGRRCARGRAPCTSRRARRRRPARAA